MTQEPGPADVHRRLWASASAIAAELEERVVPTARPSVEQEIRFNGGVAPQVARHYADILVAAGLPDGARILDLGCGFGRIAMALALRVAPDVDYVGLDPNADGIDWAQRHITPHHPNFRFRRIDVRSQPYNPHGRQAGRRFRFPFADESMDLVFMISVLTHVDLATVATYARESARVLKPTGRLVATAFLLDPEVDALLAAGKGHFAMPFRHQGSRVENPANPELAIAHPRERVLDILDQAGFAQTLVVDGHWSGRPSLQPMDFQDLVIAGHGRATVLPPAAPSEDAPTASAARHATCARILALTGGEDARLSRFITWSNALALNAFWWWCDGYSLGLPERGCATGGTVGGLRFDALKKLGLDQTRPTGPDNAHAFHPLDDASMMALLIRAGRISGREALLDAMVEAAENGLRVLEATAAGATLMLRSPTGSLEPAGIPTFTV